jgi:hypothetical protein
MQLMRLQGLRRLQLSSVLFLPDCLPQLTQLTALEVSDSLKYHSGNSEFDLVEAALQQLSQLQHLTLGPNISGLDSPPAALVCFPALHTLCWRQGSSIDFPTSSILPAGTWLASLQRLVAPAQILANSLPALAVAQQLECVGVECLGGDDAATLAVIRWAAHRSSLRHLLLQTDAVPAALCDAVLETQRRCPALLFKTCADACDAAAAIEPDQTC